ncbi:MAG: hypothetical protein JNN01_02060 [Opitutaceae bacterium]|nr:hypothetical protein [Opitutaceae bacterium]
MPQSPPPTWVRPCSKALRWSAVLATVALAPKCLLCLAAYAGLGISLGLNLASIEVCGAPPTAPNTAILWLLPTLGTLSLGIVLGFRSRQRGDCNRTLQSRPARKS